MRHFPLFCAIVLSAVPTACSHTKIHWQSCNVPRASAMGPIAVLIVPGPALPPDTADRPGRLLAIARERDAKSEILHGSESPAGKRMQNPPLFESAPASNSSHSDRKFSGVRQIIPISDVLSFAATRSRHRVPLSMSATEIHGSSALITC
jgi:hypothetical protein